VNLTRQNGVCCVAEASMTTGDKTKKNKKKRKEKKKEGKRNAFLLGDKA
jgi:hypothetical protein